MFFQFLFVLFFQYRETLFQQRGESQDNHVHKSHL